MLEQSTAQHLDRTDPESPQVQAQKAQTEPFFFCGFIFKRDQVHRQKVNGSKSQLYQVYPFYDLHVCSPFWVIFPT